MIKHVIKYTWSKSRGKFSNGRAVCRMKIDDKEVVSMMGGGDEMRGLCLMVWLKETYPEKLKAMRDIKIGTAYLFNEQYRAEIRKQVMRSLDMEFKEVNRNHIDIFILESG